jgi:hypothetical protein
MYAAHLVLLGAFRWADHAADVMRNTTDVKIILLAEHLWKNPRDIYRHAAGGSWGKRLWD